MIHDFWNRPHYHILLDYLEPVYRADSLGVFSIKDNVDMNSVERLYENFKYNPQ